MNNKEALEYFIYRLEHGQCGVKTTQREAFEKAVQVLKAIDNSNHICLTCANNQEGGCESQDLLCCKYYKENNNDN